MTETRPTEPTGIDAPPSTPVKRGDKLKWARSLESRPLAVVDLEHVTVASWGELAPLAVTLQEVAGVYPMGWFDRVDAPPSSEEVVLPLAGYPVPETVSTREHALHCFACGGALSHSCTCEHIRLHRDGLRSLIYWVQKDTLEAARAALPSTGDAPPSSELVGRLYDLHRRGVSYASDKPAVNLLLADLSEGLREAAVALDARAAFVDAPPSSREVVEKLPCPFVWELREFADDIADVTGDGAHMIRCSADVMQQMSDLLRRARQRLGPKCVPDADINLAILCDDIDALFSRPGWPSSATRAALPSTGIDELVEALERSERVLAEVFQYLDEEDGGGLLDRVDKARLDVSAALAKVRQP